MSSRRLLGLGAGLLLAAGLLSACDKPLPQITVLSNRTVTRISPTTYCFNPTRCRHTTASARSVTARSGTSILVDVPGSVADGHWLVSAYTQDSSGKQTPIEGAGSGVLHNQHSVWLPVPTSSGAYALAIQSFTGATPTGIWDVVVQLR
ncbi:MAG: DUF2771 family protein [Actinobacteria bacterium]|nr:DUF2771 family protein [Actinomycetota bacterium]